MLLVIHALATGARLLSNRWVRGIDQILDDRRVIVGHFDFDGFRIDHFWDDNCYGDLGLASSRKS